MTQPTIVSFLACEAAIGPAPFTLLNVRNRWQRPPSVFSVYLQVRNPAEAPYELSFELERARRLVARTTTELVLAYGIDVTEHGPGLSIEDLEPKVYALHALINGRRTAKLIVDFGFPGAAP